MKLTGTTIFSYFLLIWGCTANLAAQTPYSIDLQKWREKREVELKSEDGWLTLVGLFWLKDGANYAGSAATSDITLPAGTAPEEVGVFEFHQGRTILRVARGVKVRVNNKPVRQAVLKTDEKGKPDMIGLGDLRMFVIKRGEKYGVRVRNRSNPPRLAFEGLKYFPTAEDYRLTAKYVAYDKPKEIEIVNILGDVSKMPSPGYVTFELNGKACRLDALVDEKKLFFIFRDLTSGKTTYPAGRFLYAEMPKGDRVVLDFNQAINPPCAFTTFATCPLPPPQNHLKVAVEAGELAYHRSDS
jgi:uncharacterized protein (DUF1684 family)